MIVLWPLLPPLSPLTAGLQTSFKSMFACGDIPAWLFVCLLPHRIYLNMMWCCVCALEHCLHRSWRRGKSLHQKKNCSGTQSVGRDGSKFYYRNYTAFSNCGYSTAICCCYHQRWMTRKRMDSSNIIRWKWKIHLKNMLSAFYQMAI